MPYHQITQEERYRLATLRGGGAPLAEMARALGRHRSTILRELRRNRSARGRYEWYHADCLARTRRSHSRRNRRLSAADWARVTARLAQHWSPEQIAGRFRRTGELRISHETIYRYVYQDRLAGGTLHQWLRRAPRYGSRRRRCHPRGPLGARPRAVEQRRQIGHWEIDTLQGRGSRACVLSAVERRTGYVLLGKLAHATGDAFAARAIGLFRRQPRPVHTVTADNGSEMTGYPQIEERTGARFYFATPYHAWERGTNENTNGLLRQYWPKRQSMFPLTQHDGNRIARQLNQRPRKRLAYRTPEEVYEG